MFNLKPNLTSVSVESPFFKIIVDNIDWKTILVVAMILGTIVYLIKG